MTTSAEFLSLLWVVVSSFHFPVISQHNPPLTIQIQEESLHDKSYGIMAMCRNIITLPKYSHPQRRSV